MKLGEVACDDIITKLREYLPGRLAAINLEMQDDLVMIAPADTDYFPGRVGDFPRTPAVFVMEGPTKFKQEGSHGLLSEIRVLIYLFESGQTGPHLAVRLQRISRATIEALFLDEPRERTANGYNLAPVSTIPGDAFRPDSEHNDWRGYYTVVFKVEQLEH